LSYLEGGGGRRAKSGQRVPQQAQAYAASVCFATFSAAAFSHASAARGSRTATPGPRGRSPVAPCLASWACSRASVRAAVVGLARLCVDSPARLRPWLFARRTHPQLATGFATNHGGSRPGGHPGQRATRVCPSGVMGGGEYGWLERAPRPAQLDDARVVERRRLPLVPGLRGHRTKGPQSNAVPSANQHWPPVIGLRQHQSGRPRRGGLTRPDSAMAHAATAKPRSESRIFAKSTIDWPP